MAGVNAEVTRKEKMNDPGTSARVIVWISCLPGY
jgi:hypothetical protein